MTQNHGDCVIVKLSWSEIELAAFKGIKKRVWNLCNKSQGKEGRGGDDRWADNINGWIAQDAFAKGFNKYPEYSLKQRDDSDVDGYEIRSIDKEHLKLIVRPGDKDDKVCVLAYVGNLPEVKFLGWILAGDAKDHADWIYDDCWMVPQSALHKIEGLLE